MNLKLRDTTSNLIGEQLVYTGHPGGHRQMTIFGNVSGFERDGSIILHSYTWLGASGSSVFDEKGRLKIFHNLLTAIFAQSNCASFIRVRALFHNQKGL